MDEMIKKCMIERYDETIQNPPYLTIPIDKLDISKPINDNLGEEFARRLRVACKTKGYVFKFYTMSEEKNVDYNIVVF